MGCSYVAIGLTHPSRTLKYSEDLLLSDRLVGGLWVGLRRWSEDGVDIGINERNQLGVDRGACLTELAIDPILEGAPEGKIPFLNRCKPSD